MDSVLRCSLLVVAVLAVGSTSSRLPRSHGLFTPAGPSAPALGVPQFPPGPLPEIDPAHVGPRDYPEETLPSFPQTLLRTRVLPHHVPSRTVRIIKTVAVPYPVPHPVKHEVPVHIPKPYPVPVPVYGPPGYSGGHGESGKYKQSMGHAELTQAVFKGSDGTPQHYENGDSVGHSGVGGYGGGSSPSSSGGSSYGNVGSDGPSGFGNGGSSGNHEGTNYSPQYSGGNYEDSGSILSVPVPPSGGSAGEDYSQGSPNAIGAINEAFATSVPENHQGGDAGHGGSGAYTNIGGVTAGEAYTNYDHTRGAGGRDGYSSSGRGNSASGSGGDHYGSSSETKQAIDAENGNGNDGTDEERERVKKRSQHSGSPHVREKTIVTIEKAIDAGSYVHTSYSGLNTIRK